jgi:hypothetical protein
MEEKIILYTQLPKQNTILEYIESLFSCDYHGPYSKHYRACISTFKDKSCTQLDNKPARRSFEDILSLVWSKYPRATEEDVAKAICESFENGNIKSLYCNDISKNVFLITTDDFEGKYKLAWNGLLPNNDITYKGNGKYSIKEILDLAGITDYEYKKEIKNE